jgi:hypothetical protein
MKDKVKTPRLTQAPIYELWLDRVWQQNYSYRLQKWFRWGWCRLDEVVELINRHYDLKWTRVDLLQRFSIPVEQGQVKFGANGCKRGCDLQLLWINPDSGELHCRAHKRTDYIFLQNWNDRPVYAPSAWVRDVLWALYGGCTRVTLKNGEKIACTEDGMPVFAMTGAGKAN